MLRSIQRVELDVMPIGAFGSLLVHEQQPDRPIRVAGEDAGMVSPSHARVEAISPAGFKRAANTL
jgi:hypothetical protein